MATTLPVRAHGNPVGLTTSILDNKNKEPVAAINRAGAPTVPPSADRPSTATTLSGTTSSRPSTATSTIVPPAFSKSFAQRVVQRASNPSLRTKKSNIETSRGTGTMRNIERGAPGDPIGRRRSQINPDVQKMKNTYFENEFAASNRDPESARSRVENEAIVMADFRTNVIIEDEFNFMTDLSYLLSNRYQRPISSIVVSVTHSCCLMFGGTFESAYTLTINALPSLVQPTTNKRNAALIQKHFEDTLGVRSSRGLVRFVPMPEDEVACSGRTLASEMEELDKVTSGDESAAVSRKVSKAKSSGRLRPKSFAAIKTSSALDLKVPTPPPSARSEHMHIPAIPESPLTPPEENRLLGEKESVRKSAGRRKSFRFALFGSSKPDPMPELRPNTAVV